MSSKIVSWFFYPICPKPFEDIPLSVEGQKNMIPSADLIPGLNRKSLFSFDCGRCSQCCAQKKIQVNPYEVAMLAAKLNITTTEFIRSYTLEGVYLRNRDDGKCVFLGTDGCSVHTDRPLVCRLYPIGRQLSAEGDESFVLASLHPGCKASWSKAQTIEDYMTEQGVHAFIKAAECYRSLLRKAVTKLAEGKQSSLPEWVTVSAGSDLQVSFPKMLDQDWVIENIAKAGKAILDPWQKMMLHVRTIENWLINHNDVKEKMYENR